MAPKKPGVRKNLTELQVLASSLKKLAEAHYVVQIGIFAAKDPRRGHAGVSNAEVGFIHEMGSVERKIPRRSFLFDTFSLHGDKVVAMIGPATKRLFAEGKVDEYLKRVGLASVNLVQEAFFTSGWGSWAPLAYSTILAKLRKKTKNLARRRQMAAEVLYEDADHVKILIESGQLWQSVDARVAKGGAVT